MNLLIKTFKSITLVLTVTGIGLVSSCKKEEIQGPKGDPGTPGGGGGNVSISNSNVFTIASSEWVKNSDGSAWEFTLNSALLTQEVVDNGAVKIFVKRGTSWTELPNTQGDLFTQFSFVVGSVNLTFEDIHGTLPAKPATADYRMLTISAAERLANFSGSIITTDKHDAH